MLSTILSAFTVPEIRKKLAFTAAILLLYRFGAFIPSPGIDADAVEASVLDDAHGALVAFRGIVRDHDTGRAVTGLDYQAHPEEAKKMIGSHAAPDMPPAENAAWVLTMRMLLNLDEFITRE